MRILLLGQNGQVGSEITALMQQQTDIECLSLNRLELDLCDYTTIASKLAGLGHFDWIINAAAYTAVDKAETEPEIADAVNHLAVREIAQFASLKKIRLLHFSTDYVFAGNNHTPYIETDTPNPTNVYGQTKLAGEKALHDCLEQHFILRTSWIFSTHGHNFLKTILRLLQNNASLNIVADQQGIPTAAKELARITLAFIQRDMAPGIYHCCNEGTTNWYEFACYIKDCVAKQTSVFCDEIHPIKTTEYPTPAKRPLYSVMNTDKIKACGINPQPWQGYVDEAVNLLLQEKALCEK